MRRLLFALLIARVAGAEPHVVHSHARKRAPVDADSAADDKARAALAVIDGTTWVEPAPRGDSRAPDDSRASTDSRASDDRRDAAAIARSLKPWRATILDRRSTPTDGGLAGAEKLEPGDGYYLRRPQRAYGAPHVVEYVQHAVAEVRALYPDVPVLAIGDLSAEHGGELAGHVSHRSGRDVDIGFYFHHAARGFEEAGDDLDLDATWALLAAFARTADRSDGVQMIFLDYAVQKRLYDFAKARGTPDDELAFLFQYPAGKDAMTGLVRHWPHHGNHLHVRFKPAGSR